MTDLRSKFNTWYFNEFHSTILYRDTEETIEDSPWHREKNVAIHTDMVVGQYVGLSPQVWHPFDLFGALACAFHDVGKPAAEEKRYSKERGHYRRYTGHELISARLWEDYAVRNWKTLVETFGLAPEDLQTVGWTIEHHLPYGVKKKDKVEAFLRNIHASIGAEIFRRVLRADTLGKICDDHEEKIRGNNEWLDEFFDRSLSPWTGTDSDAPTMYMLIGASGSGKSTFTMTLDYDKTTVYSWDQLRMDYYLDKDERKLPAQEQYRIAFEKSTKDKEFNSKVNKEYIERLKTGKDVVIDNTNGSNKRRRFFIQEARQRGYAVVAVLFPIELDTLIARQDIRPDKTVPEEAVRRQYMNLQYPFYGDFDEIRVISSNL